MHTPKNNGSSPCDATSDTATSAGCTPEFTSCACNNWIKQNQYFMDHRADFHYHNCPLASRIQRHDSPEAPLKDLCKQAKRTIRLRQHITVNFDDVLNPTAKIMDATIADPHNVPLLRRLPRVRPHGAVQKAPAPNLRSTPASSTSSCRP